MLRKLDRNAAIEFTDIAAPDFDATELGIERERLDERIHARLPDGQILSGVEVFRRIYALVGYGGLARLSRLPGLSHALEGAYSVFARNRLRLTGRCGDRPSCSATGEPRRTSNPSEETYL